MHIRRVGSDEYDETAMIIIAAYQALPGGHMSEEYAQELAAVGRRATEAEVYVAVEGGVLGSVTLVPDAASAWAEALQEGEAGIRMLAVAPDAQGRGVGRALLATCIDRARQLGRAAVFLHTTPWMPVAARMYERAGFERVQERDWAPVPEVPLRAYRLTLR